MNYELAIEKLRTNHIYPIVRKDKDTKKEVITGLEVSCNSFTVDSKKEVVEKVLGDKFKVEWMGSNHNYILITKK